MKINLLLKKIMLVILVILIMMINGGMINSTALPGEEKVTVIKNVNIIPMTEEKVLRGQYVLLKGAEILAIGPIAELKIPGDAKIIDGGSGYLIPGMADMHVHLINCGPVLHLNLYLANGVTTIRDLCGAPYMLNWKKEIKEGKRLGPTLYVSCPAILGNEPNVAQLVNSAAKSNYDCMKLYSYFKKDDFNHAVQTAKAQGLYTVGHVPFKVGVEGVIEAGLKEIAHIEEIAWFLADLDTTLNLASQEWHVYLFKAFQKTYPGCFGDPIETFKERLKERLTKLVKKIKVSKMVVCSTLVVDENLALKLTDLDNILSRPWAQYLPDVFTERLRKGNDPHQQTFKGREHVSLYLYEMCKLLLKELKRQGIPVVLGTDAYGANLAVVPGFSLHRELQIMTTNGYSPYEALVTCTVNAARVARGMGKKGNFGTIEKGKRADLVLLKDNPLENIENTQTILGVMAAGKWFPKEELEKFKHIKEK